jgi:Tfp pilus assembly protein PilF
MNRIEKLLEFLQQNPDDFFVKHALALEFIKLQNETKAEALFIEILTQNENYYGSYYHLAKLYERVGDTENAITIYKKGIQICKALNEKHALGELQSAYEELTF